MDNPIAALADDELLELLHHGGIEIEGRLVDASNTTLRGLISHAGVTARCVYKPVRGERPLWDFPDGTLAGREYAARLVSDATGWAIVPPTVLRDGPLGEGMVQIWIDEDRQTARSLVDFVPSRRLPAGWHRVAAARDDSNRPYVLAHSDDPGLMRMAVFDAVVNNADRKGGHILSTVDGGIFGVDHGVCFHAEGKLRTVLWGWAGVPLPPDAVGTLEKLRDELDGPLGESLAPHLTAVELAALARRVNRLLKRGCLPRPSSDWPALPWPPI